MLFLDNTLHIATRTTYNSSWDFSGRNVVENILLLYSYLNNELDEEGGDTVSMQAHILSAGIVEWNITSPRKQASAYILGVLLEGNLLPPPWPLKDNDRGCVSECAIMVLYRRILNCGFYVA